MEHAPYDWLRPDWPAPPWVHACSTSRKGGMSDGPYDCLNLGDHVGDNSDAVLDNRKQLQRLLALPAEPYWLNQVHGSHVLALTNDRSAGSREADAAWTAKVGQVCVVLTADCLPILLCDQRGRRVAAVHAGWRGLAAGVIEATVTAMQIPGEDLLAWMGPAIGPQAFEVGNEVRDTFLAWNSVAARAFKLSRPGHYWMDIYSLARQRLQDVGVLAVYGGDCCTYTDAERFYSFRRDGTTGRMASLIWLDQPGD